MKIKNITLILALLAITGCYGPIAKLTGCYGPITGTVVDAETGKPVEGAVVVVEWTKRIGFGHHYTKSHKLIETLTNKEGKVIIPGVCRPLLDPVDVTVYKKGYVAWNNYSIFPDDTKRTDFKWGDYTFKLERFKPDYSYDKHVSFISDAAHFVFGNKKLISQAYQWEESKASRERDDRSSGGGSK